MRIIHIATEIAPLAKVGGLGDVVGGLSKAQAEKGHKVQVILPAYEFLFNQPIHLDCTFEAENNTKISVFSFMYHHCSLSFIHPHSKKKFFSRKKIYGYTDDAERFLFFSKYAFDYLLFKREKIDVLHLHDWHTSMIAFFAKKKKKTSKIKKVILTLHNPRYQGSCNFKKLTSMGLEKNKYLQKPLLKNGSNFLNLLKVGLYYSDNITTVSPTYGKELFLKSFSVNLFPLIKKRRNKIQGILNGIDTNIWNPQSDPHIIKNYSSKERAKNILLAKKKNKIEVQKKLKMEKSSSFLVASIGRLAKQKGPDLIAAALEYTLEKKGQFILLGTPETKKIEHDFKQLQKKYIKNPNVAFLFTFDEKLSRLIYSAADFMVIPSRYEPCGLTQMISFCYGTIPIARKTGGLADTVIEKENKKKQTGFTFTSFSQKDLFKALERAFFIYNNEPKKHRTLIKRIMNLDVSWNHSMKEYLKIYRSDH